MIYVVVFFASLILTYFIKEYSIKKSLLDIPNDRSSHSFATPHGGGIAIAITWFIGLSYLFFINEIDTTLYYALMVGIFISTVSYLDDLFELSAKFRLFIQAIVASLGLYILGGLNEINLVFISIDNQIITNIFAFFLIIWFINLYNFLDGIDGYAASEALFLSLAGYLFFHDAHFLFLFASVAGFLIWNWHKAKIFMGDVGSTLLGYNVAIFTLYYANGDADTLWIWIALFSLFWFDATLTLFRRYRNREKISEAHKKHAYQRLTQSGWSHSKVVSWAMLVNIVIFLVVYFIKSIELAMLVIVIVLYATTKYVDSQKGFS